MDNYKKYFKGKKVTIMGLAAEGRGVQDALFALKYGATVTMTDMKPAEEFAEPMARLDSFVVENNLTPVVYHLGGHEMSDFTDADLVIRSASAVLDSPYLKAAHDAGVPVHTDESLFFELVKENNINLKTIGITGTRGKSTVTQLVYEILKSKFGGKVKLAGNLRGLATLPLLETIKDGDYLVMELDSWKLQGLGEHGWSPQVAVFTNFMNDHMNYYAGSDPSDDAIRAGMDRYLADKAQIFLHQTAADYLVLGKEVAGLIKEKYGDQIKSKISMRNNLPEGWQLKVVGLHNEKNVELAVSAAALAGVDFNEAKEVAENFVGLPGRLEDLGEINGVRHINDNNATSPDATIAALNALPDYKNKIILIAGGADKEFDYEKFAEKVAESVRALILFKGAATEKIKQLLPEAVQAIEVDSMGKAVTEAQGLAEVGDVILLSPGAASFGIFKNEYDRGDQFVELVQKLK